MGPAARDPVETVRAPPGLLRYTFARRAAPIPPPRWTCGPAGIKVGPGQLFRGAAALLVLAFLAWTPPVAAQSVSVTASNLSTSGTNVTGSVDTTITVSGLTAGSDYTVALELSTGLGFDTSCLDQLRSYAVDDAAASEVLPAQGEALRIYVCAAGGQELTVNVDGAATRFPITATTAAVPDRSLAVRNLPGILTEGATAGWLYVLTIATGVEDSVYRVDVELDSPTGAASLSASCDAVTRASHEAQYGPGSHDVSLLLTACYPAALTVRLQLSEYDADAALYVRLGTPATFEVATTPAPAPDVSLSGLTTSSATPVSGSLQTALALSGLAERLSYEFEMTLAGALGFDRGCEDTTRTYRVGGAVTITLPTETLYVCGVGAASVRIAALREGVSDLVWVFPVAASGQRPELALSGIPRRIGDTVDWTVVATRLTAATTYTMTVTVPQGLALDAGCATRTRTYVIANAETYTAPPTGETLRVVPCETGEDYTVEVRLEASDTETVRREAVVSVDATVERTTMLEGFLPSPRFAALLGARRYGDVVLVMYHVDYADVDLLPDAPDAWWVEGRNGAVAVVSESPVAYTRAGWGHGLVALDYDHGAVVQVGLRGMPGRYASGLDASRPVEVGGDLGAELLLALRALSAMPEWEGQELVNGEWLGADGMAYLEAVLPTVRELAPEIYSSRIVDYQRQQSSPTTRDDQGILPVSALEGMTGAAARESRLSETLFRLGATAVLAVIAAGAAVKMGGSGLLALPAVGLVLVGGTIIGFVPLALTLGIGLVTAIVIGFALWGKRA